MKTGAIPSDATEARKLYANKIAFTTCPVELSRQIQNGDTVTLIDVRKPEDYRAGHIPHAVNLPQEKWGTPKGLHRDKISVLYGYSKTCRLAVAAAVGFAEQGFPVMEMEGGFQAWQEHELPIEK